MHASRTVKNLCIAAATVVALFTAGCKSYWIEATVENHTGQPIQQLEVDYPTASFGNNTLASGATMHYRFQIRGSGPVKVEYTSPDGTLRHAEGLHVFEHQQGQLTIRLEPQGKVEFVPNLQPAS